MHYRSMQCTYVHIDSLCRYDLPMLHAPKSDAKAPHFARSAARVSSPLLPEHLPNMSHRRSFAEGNPELSSGLVHGVNICV